MLTHYPDAPGGAGEGASAADREVADRVLHGEVIRDATGWWRVIRMAGADGGVWLQRTDERRPSHHALSRYLAEDELPVGSWFDTYV